jgi:hypothetical protein
VAALRKAGVDLGTDLGAALTAGQVAGILGSLGVRIAAMPDAAATVSTGKADQIVQGVVLMRGGTFNMNALSSQGNCPVSPSSPGDCNDNGQGNQNGQHGP